MNTPRTMFADCAAMAEIMAAQDIGYVRAGQQIGITPTHAKTVWRAMRKSLGWQAV